jgi:hypothetical protein
LGQGNVNSYAEDNPQHFGESFRGASRERMESQLFLIALIVILKNLKACLQKSGGKKRQALPGNGLADKKNFYLIRLC